jgi:hypothetical protein
MDQKTCVYCKAPFAPNKYSPRQTICSSRDCQRKRQLESMRLWRQRNPNYFKYDESKGPLWLEMQRKRSKLWREKNPDKVRSYRSAHSEESREDMRSYMRQYRERQKTNGPQGSSPGTATMEGNGTP